MQAISSTFFKIYSVSIPVNVNGLVPADDGTTETMEPDARKGVTPCLRISH